MILMAALLIMALQSALQGPVLTPPGMHPYSMPSRSMRPNIDDGEVVMADRLRGQCGDTLPAPGDVVILDLNGTPYVKRIVAGPGQTVQMIAGRLYIDGAPVEQSPVDARNTGSAVGDGDAGLFRETLPNGADYLILDHGPGYTWDDTPELVVPADHWFTLGDNRDNSLDGRHYGPTPSADLCGTAVRIIRSPNPERVGLRP